MSSHPMLCLPYKKYACQVWGNVNTLMTFIALRISYMAYELVQIKAEFKDLGWGVAGSQACLFAEQLLLEGKRSIATQGPSFHALAGADVLLSAQDWAEVWTMALTKHCTISSVLDFLTNRLGVQDLESRFSLGHLDMPKHEVGYVFVCILCFGSTNIYIYILHIDTMTTTTNQQNFLMSCVCFNTQWTSQTNSDGMSSVCRHCDSVEFKFSFGSSVS